MEPILETEKLTKVFYSRRRVPVTALNQVSFRLYPGQILGIVGESGSGKTTLARAVTRLTPLTGGMVQIEGQDITHIKGASLRKIYQKIQMVFQCPMESFDPSCTLGDGIGESLRNYGYSKRLAAARTEFVLEQCGLSSEFAKRYPREVSVGQCQRAAIARALAIQPKILVCDEATSSLDVTVQRQILKLLRTLQETTRLSILFICHDLALAQSFCDFIIVMKDGVVIEQGRIDEVIHNPKSEYTRDFLASVL